MAGYEQKAVEFPRHPGANGSGQEDFCPSFSTDLRPCVLLAGTLQREGGNLTSVLRSERLAGRSLSSGGL